MAFEVRSPSEQVAAHLREEIVSGRWKSLFPGTPAIAAELGVDRKTVTAAIRQLEQAGILKSQGAGRPRLVSMETATTPSRLNIRYLLHENDDRQRAHVMDLIPRVQELGHHIEIERKTLTSMGMDLRRIRSHVAQYPADVWILLSATREVLEWFAKQDTPAFAIFGRRRSVPIASVGPDKVAALHASVSRLVELGHRRIVLMAREERRHPYPGHVEAKFLEALEHHGITPGAFHLPEWKDDPGSFHKCLESLFEHTPPTALIFDEAQFYVAGLQHLAQMKLSPPGDVSLVSCDNHAIFDWCRPSVSHIQWGGDPIVDRVILWLRQIAKGINQRKAWFTPAEFIEGGSIGPAPDRS